ncbi:replication-relaxation family protein [Nocardia terpenica]|uniref:replication-relaxation family protein n=1 Tax=Nocardia terpenica TaxID=455432 RepID=UPI002B4B7E49|nr:replication-relaxation family protein [Nocardia terpenica]
MLSVLAEHKVLTTDQIAALEFTSTRRAQDRLRKLREMGMLFAFRESLYGGGASQTRHALGYLGAPLIAAQRAEKPPECHRNHMPVSPARKLSPLSNLRSATSFRFISGT